MRLQNRYGPPFTAMNQTHIYQHEDKREGCGETRGIRNQRNQIIGVSFITRRTSVRDVHLPVMATGWIDAGLQLD